MKTLKLLLLILLLNVFAMPMQSQDNNKVVPQRTPEQEAVRQTERLQKELGLTAEQVKLVYEINLRYARARQVSNSRNEAIERMKNKSADLEKVLNAQQNERLQSKRFERTAAYPSAASRNLNGGPSTLRSSSEYRSGEGSRVPSTEYRSGQGLRVGSPESRSVQGSRMSSPESNRRTCRAPVSSGQSTESGQSVRRSSPGSTYSPLPSRSQSSESSSATRTSSGSSGSESRRSDSSSGSSGSSRRR